MIFLTKIGIKSEEKIYVRNYPVRNRANDVDYVYHQDPDFYYLTGYKEPHAVLFVFKDDQKASNGSTYNEIIFIQPRNERAAESFASQLHGQWMPASPGLLHPTCGHETRLSPHVGALPDAQ